MGGNHERSVAADESSADDESEPSSSHEPADAADDEPAASDDVTVISSHGGSAAAANDDEESVSAVDVEPKLQGLASASASASATVRGPKASVESRTQQLERQEGHRQKERPEKNGQESECPQFATEWSDQ